MGRLKSVLPVRPEKCATCPFREGSKFAYLAKDLAASALTDASRICHSTGSGNAINRRTGRPPALCRGARDVQLQHFHSIGFISAPTDKAWAEKIAEVKSRPAPRRAGFMARTGGYGW